MTLRHGYLEHPQKSLISLFICWKAVLLSIAACAPGVGYDTSTQILLRAQDFSASTPFPGRLASNLVRWDAIYFTQIAKRGYTYEQEWAFSYFFSFCVALLVKVIPNSAQAYAWAGIIIANVSHILSVLILYRLVIHLRRDSLQVQTAFIAAALHVISPAGMFLSAPYGESLFSLLNFLGMYHYVMSVKVDMIRSSWGFTHSYLVLMAGIFFGLATLIRSNGLLSGLILVYDAIGLLMSIVQSGFTVTRLRKLATLGLAGFILGLAFVIPQWIAYEGYCNSNLHDYARPWCMRHIPSIYTWVQDHYWNVGFLRYWTLSNIPLFLLGVPMIWILVESAVLTFFCNDTLAPLELNYQPPVTRVPAKEQSSELSSLAHKNEIEYLCSRRFALAQLVLACLALTNFHVQIINRISSGYPLWYVTIAKAMTREVSSRSIHKGVTEVPHWIVRAMVIYAMVQGGLFASFLPPA